MYFPGNLNNSNAIDTRTDYGAVNKVSGDIALFHRFRDLLVSVNSVKRRLFYRCEQWSNCKMCFCAVINILLNVFLCCTLGGLGPSWINKYDNNTASRWQQVCFNKLLIESFISNDSFNTADSIETKQVSPSEWTVESLAHWIRSKTDSFKELNTVLLCTVV